MELEIKVMWCKGLTAFNFFQKLTIYANVSITSEDQRMQLTEHQKQEQKTPVDEQGDGDPEWNHTMTFDLRRLESLTSTFENLSVVFELRHQGQLFGDKTVGDVHVPLRDLINSVGNDVGRFVSYQVRSPEGTGINMYPPPPVIYPPPQQHQWGPPPPPQAPHFPPPTAPPVVYPLPPNGDPHWGYPRPPDYNQPNSGYDGYRRW